MIDIIEQQLLELGEKVLNILLMDRTTRKNICWATDQYLSYGYEYSPQEPITLSLITGLHTNVIKPRVLRNISEQSARTKDKAEVYTPAWLCNEQNNLVDAAWFGREHVFNMQKGKNWVTIKDKIKFPKHISWTKYIDAKRLEVSCGEAPYLVSRYDSVTGREIGIEDRIGLLDRKLRIINEQVYDENEWYIWVKRAYQSIYGYEYQGDSLLIARENLLYTFIENMKYKFFKEPILEELCEIAKIISWNIWQMDGVTMTVPYAEREPVYTEMSLFEYIEGEEVSNVELVPSKIFDWRSNCSFEFKKMIKGGL